MLSIEYQSNNNCPEQLRQQVDEMQGLLKTQLKKFLEKENNPSYLEERADRLQKQTEHNFTLVDIRKKKRRFRKTGRCAIL